MNPHMVKEELNCFQISTLYIPPEYWFPCSSLPYYFREKIRRIVGFARCRTCVQTVQTLPPLIGKSLKVVVFSFFKKHKIIWGEAEPLLNIRKGDKLCGILSWLQDNAAALWLVKLFIHICIQTTRLSSLITLSYEGRVVRKCQEPMMCLKSWKDGHPVIKT